MEALEMLIEAVHSVVMLYADEHFIGREVGEHDRRCC
jgi:hypothetical protein